MRWPPNKAWTSSKKLEPIANIAQAIGHTPKVHLDSYARFKPDLVISTHPHINRGHFNLAKKISKNNLRTITCCTELDGGFGFSRNWVSCKADRFWALTNEVAIEVSKRGYNSKNIFAKSQCIIHTICYKFIS